MTARESIVTRDQFTNWISQPENEGRLFEFIHGEIIEVSPGRSQLSEYHDLISFAVRLFCRDHGLPCHTATADGSFDVGGNVVAPDFAYKPTRMSHEYPDPIAPQWVVEIISPTDRADDIRDKREIYIAAGILLWEIYPKPQSIDVYAPGKPKRTLGITDTLDGGHVLPNFRLPVREIFEGEA